MRGARFGNYVRHRHFGADVKADIPTAAWIEFVAARLEP